MTHSDAIVAQLLDAITRAVRDHDATVTETTSIVEAHMLAIIDHLDEMDYPVPVLRHILALEGATVRHQIEVSVADFRDLVRQLLDLLPTTPCN